MGKPVLNKPTLQDVDFNGVKIPNGVELWSIGTDTAKGTLYNRLKLTETGGGYYHFPIGLDEEFYRQLCAEKIVKRYVKGYATYEWVKTRSRNEILGCAVYCLAAAYRSGVSRLNWDKIAAGLSTNPVLVSAINNNDMRQRQPVRKIERPKRDGGYVRPNWMS